MGFSHIAARPRFFAWRAGAQQSSEIEATRTANQAFYAALSSRDLDAMAAVWAKKPYVVNIGPRSTKVLIGYEDAVANNWPRTFERWSEGEVKISSIAHIYVDDKLTSVVGTESAAFYPNEGGDPREFDLL